ncbi:MAG: hypothetical protein JWR21_1095 [Herminiimonas sp.]|nr:hypothetical protein [Herminiimonas sp.]
MSALIAESPRPTQFRSMSGQMRILQTLSSLTSVVTLARLEDFTDQLSAAFLHLSEQSARPVEAQHALNSFSLLRIEAGRLQHSIKSRLHDLLDAELHRIGSNAGTFNSGRTQHAGNAVRADQAGATADLSLVSFEEMENKVLLNNFTQALEKDVADPLGALNLRLAWLLEREDFPTSANPFRPEVFVQAVYQAWCEIDEEPASRQVLLRMLGPELFLPLASILHQLNEALVERNILPDLADAWRRRKVESRPSTPHRDIKPDRGAQYGKLRNWLLSRVGSTAKLNGADAADNSGGEASPDNLNLPDLFATDDLGGWSTNTISVQVAPRLFGHLNALQAQTEQLAAMASAGGKVPQVPKSAELLRRVPARMPPGTLTQVDQNTIELLARIFDFTFAQPQIPDEMKTLLGQLQIPLLKAALLDKKMFVNDDHPARVLMDRLAQSSLGWQPEKGKDDPLFKMVEEIVGSVQKDIDAQMRLFSDAAARLDSFMVEEDKRAQERLAEPIATADREERLARAKEHADKTIATRVDSGEVAGFVQNFLELHWSRIIALGFSARHKRPDVLEKAVAAMDDLIWSLRPKNSPEERKELITRLPAILSMVNAWLNVIKWEGPERVAFFSELAQRHASIVRTAAELPRHRVEEAVNVAMRAVERGMSRKRKPASSGVRDEFTRCVESMHVNEWLRFVREDGRPASFRLVWISPHRSRFIFARRSGATPFTLSSQEFAASLRDGKATVLEQESVTERALSEALQD